MPRCQPAPPPADAPRSARAAACCPPRHLALRARALAGLPDTQRRALAADHGFRAGHEDDFAALLQQCCARLARDGLTYLIVYSSPRSPGWSVLEAMAIAGVHVDPIYF